MSQKPTYEELEKQVAALKETQAALEKSQAALKDSEEKYRTTFESITDSITVTRLKDGLYMYVNDGFCQRTGYSRDEVLGRTPADINLYVAPEERERFVGILKKYGEAKNVVVRFRRKNQTVNYSELSAKLIIYEGEKCLLSQSRDITDRIHSEEALRTSEEKHKEMIANISDVIAIVDKNGIVQYKSPNIKKRFGWNPEDLVGKSSWITVHPDDSDYVQAEFLDLVEHETAQKNIEYRYKCKDGSYKWIKLTAFNLLKNPSISGILTNYHDITDRRKAEQKLQQATEQLNQAQKMESIGRLAGGVAHDFNNMLSIILGHSEIILEDLAPSSPLTANIKEIQKGAERSTNLTRQLLAFARKQTVSPKILDLNDTIEGMLEMLKRLIGENIDFSWHPGKNLWPVKIDPSQMDQILANLCVNARDAIKGVGKIVIKTENVSFDSRYCMENSRFRPGSYVVISVCDSGVGMDEKTLENLFEPFFTTKQLGEGTGLGLATVYGIVTQNEGFITVDTELKKGSTFNIYLSKQTEPIKTDPHRQTTDISSRGHETILLVEDEVAILNMTKKMLERLGYEVIAASNPDQALEFAVNYCPGEIHLLMTDVVMPKMNGRDLATKLSERYPGLKCLFMSGYTADVIANHGILDRDLNFIGKPFAWKDLAMKLRETLDTHLSGLTTDTTENIK